MSEASRMVSGAKAEGDDLERHLRPQMLSEFVGQAAGA
jgi:Holliday junction resolvasome RuvABC ATP-dependent DNA helicase subunit